MQKTPRGLRPYIVITGRRNAGKSSIINAITGQSMAIVSDVEGTTTDPVSKAMEVLPVGPVVIVDTAGYDDVGELGKERVKKTEKMIKRADIGIIVMDERGWEEQEEEILKKFKRNKSGLIIVLNKIDKYSAEYIEEVEKLMKIKGEKFVKVSAQTGEGIDELKNLIKEVLPKHNIQNNTIIGDMVNGGDLVLLVAPIDLEAPAGRLILPQVQVLRDILDNDAVGMIVKEKELLHVIENMKIKPNLVIIDSQAVLEVSGDLPGDIPFTTFSILFARLKGDLPSLIEGVFAIETLNNGDKVLISEACTHYTAADDIGRVKIPRWILNYTNKDIQFDVFAGKEFPDNIDDYKLVVHCGGCVITKREMLSRMDFISKREIPMTNYGVAISYLHGLLRRTLEPIPGMLDFYEYLEKKYSSKEKRK